MMGKIQNKHNQLINELSELIDNYNNDRQSSLILGRFSNEIRPHQPLERGGGDAEGNPHKLYNKISKSDIGGGKKTSPRRFMEEIEASNEVH